MSASVDRFRGATLRATLEFGPFSDESAMDDWLAEQDTTTVDDVQVDRAALTVTIIKEVVRNG